MNDINVVAGYARLLPYEAAQKILKHWHESDPAFNLPTEELQDLYDIALLRIFMTRGSFYQTTNSKTYRFWNDVMQKIRNKGYPAELAKCLAEDDADMQLYQKRVNVEAEPEVKVRRIIMPGEPGYVDPMEEYEREKALRMQQEARDAQAATQATQAAPIDDNGPVNWGDI